MKPKHTTNARIECRLSLWTKLRILFGYKLIVEVRTDYRVYDPGIIRSNCITGTVAPWCRWFGHKHGPASYEQSGGRQALVTKCVRCRVELSRGPEQGAIPA